MKIKFLLHIISFCLILIEGNSLWGQNNTAANSNEELKKSLYETTLLEMETILLKQTPEDSLVFLLLQDAREFAGGEDWEGARSILNSAMEMLSVRAVDENSFENALLEDVQKRDNVYSQQMITTSTLQQLDQFQIEVGFDYSIQEFEIALIEDDSTLIEELHNPYLSLTYYQPFRIGRQTLQLNHRFRVDNQFLNYSLFGLLENRTSSRVTRLEFDGDYFHIQNSGESDFIDSRLLFFYGNPQDTQNRWYVDFRARFKWYSAPDELSSHTFTGGLNMYYEHFFNFNSSIYFNWLPTLYKEFHISGYNYTQNRFLAFYRMRESYNRYIELGIEAVQNAFDNVISGENYQNRYLSLMPRLEFEQPLASWFGFYSLVSLERRNYRTADAINPNYTYLTANAVSKFYLGDLKSIGAGILWERQTHEVNLATDASFAQQGDFHSKGLVFVVEYITLSGLMLNLEYQIRSRDYPNSEDSFFNSYYSNRMVHSISLFGWIPLSAHWQIQLFANYDNDQDRDRTHNDNRNTIMNVGIIYKF